MVGHSFISKLDDTSAIVLEENIYDSLLKQYERVLIESLVETFGLDRLIIEDKYGGDVDTINNVRQIENDGQMKYKSETNKNAYLDRGEFDTKKYHGDSKFIKIKKSAKQKYNDEGILINDAYENKSLELTNASSVSKERRAELDHVVECKVIHDDRGRVLAGLNGLNLANDENNFAWTNKSLNASMGSWARHKNEKWKKEHGCDAPLDVVGMEAYIKEHPNIDSRSAERMRAQYKKSRQAYEKQVAKVYYTSPSFYKDTAKAAGKLSFNMGVRAALGFVFVELWISAREEVAIIEKDCAEWFRAVGRGIQKGFENSKIKYKELWTKFLNGAIGGALSSLVTTLSNIFFTTAKSTVRIIRQSWASLVEAARIMLYNPDCLRFGERVRATTKILATGASVVAGVMLTEAINKTAFGAIPYVGDIAATFCGTLLTGLMTCSLLFMLDRNETVNKIVETLDQVPAIENYIAYAKEQARLLQDYAAKVYDIDSERFRIETSVIVNAVLGINAEMNDASLLLGLRSIYEDLGFDNPWGNENTLDSFMSGSTMTLTFK